MVLVEVGRKQTRKVCNNVRGVTGLGCILSPPLYMQIHWTDTSAVTRRRMVVMTVCLHMRKCLGTRVAQWLGLQIR